MADVFTCTICQIYSSSTLKGVLRHIGSVHSFEPGFSITCGIQGCARTYKNFRSFQKHILRQHEADVEEISSNTPINTLGVDMAERDNTLELSDDDNEEANPLNIKSCLKRNAALFLLRTKEIDRVTQRALDHIVEGVTNLYQAYTDDHTFRPFEGLETKFLQEQFFCQHFKLLNPVERRLGQSLRRKTVKTVSKLKLCWDFAYDIPLLDSLQCLLSKDWILEEIQRGHRRTDGFIGDYCDGDACSVHPLFSTDSEALQILLFYDDLEVANPLGSYTKKHKIAVFYYTLANISPKYRSSLDIINLLCIVKSVDVGTYGIDKVLEPFMKDIAKLEADEGVNFDIGGHIYNFKGSLALVAADNLASQYIGGYKALNSALRKCRHCMAVSGDMGLKFLASDFIPRTRSTHSQHCSMLQAGCPDHVATTYGLTRDSSLNTSKYFHVTDGLPPDCMHDILEGCLQYEIKELLKACIMQGYLTLDEINSRIQLFPYSRCDAVNKPSPINLSSSDHSLRQSASQMWCLARLLPVIIGDRIPEDDIYWQNYLRLLKIVDFVFAPVSTRDIAAYLTSLIEDYLSTFTELYPNSRIIPKQHYLLHIPMWIIRCGPLTGYWCMRFEAKNSHFKDIVQRINNFKNIPKSIALRHQGWSCYISCGISGRERLTTGHVNQTVINQFPYAQQILEAMPTLTEESIVQTSSWVQINGTKYKPNDIVVLSTEFCLPVFGKILSIILTDTTQCRFVCELLITNSFHCHYHAYEVCKQSQTPINIVVCSQSDFLDFHTLGLYSILNCSFIVMKYYIPGC